MGIIRPPWISKDWFRRCPFNYCDHFGDKKLLATVCIICKEDLERIEKCKRKGKDPHDMTVVIDEVAEDLAKSMAMVFQDAKEMGIDLDNLPEEENKYSYDQEPIYLLVQKYSENVQKIIHNLEVVPIETDDHLLEKALDAFAHSEHYVIAKTGRALFSLHEELDDPFMFELADSKTSAFLAYIAILRNCRAALALTKHKPLRELREKHLKFAQVSLKVAEMLRKTFFPKDKLIYKEFGYTDF